MAPRKVKQRLQVNGIRLGTSIQDNITIVKLREDIDLRKGSKRNKAVRDFLAHHVLVVSPS